MLSYTASILALVGSALIVSHIPGLELKPKLTTPEVKEWNNTSLPGQTHSPIIYSERTEDAKNLTTVIPRVYFNIRESEFLNLSRNIPCKTCYKDKDLNIWNKWYSYLLPTNIIDAEYFNFEKKELKSGLLFTQNFNMWIWPEYIKKFFIKEPTPRGFHFISSF